MAGTTEASGFKVNTKLYPNGAREKRLLEFFEEYLEKAYPGDPRNKQIALDLWRITRAV